MKTIFIRRIPTYAIATALFCFFGLYVFAGEFETAKEHEKGFDPIIAKDEMQHKRKIPVYKGNQWNPTKDVFFKIPKESAGVFFGGKKQHAVEIRESKNPGENSSLGFTGTFVKVATSEPHIDGTLILPIKSNKKGLVDVRRVYIFRWDEGSKRFIKMPRSGVNDDGKYVWARITKPGDYAVIGQSNDLQIQAFTRSICASAELPSHSSLTVQEICKAILCRGDRMSGGRPPLPGGPALDDICQRCLRLEGIRLPECEFEHLPLPELCLNKWHSLGPFNMAGVVTRIELDPNNPDKIYALSDPGGLWVLDNTLNYPNRSWQPLTDELDSSRLQTFTLGADGSQTIVYLADVFNNLFRSDDGGKNWKSLGTIATLPQVERSVRNLILRPDNHQLLYVATRFGLFLSHDGGERWMPRLRDGNILDAAIDPDNASIIYIAVNGTGVFKLNGQGVWEHIFKSDQLILGEGDDFLNSMKIALGYKNANGTKQTDSDRLVVVKVHKKTQVDTGPVYSKRNNENVWCRLGDNSGTQVIKSVLAVNPHNSEVIIDGGVSLWWTKNGGPPWIPTSGTHADHLCVVFDPRNGAIVYASTDGGIYRSENGGIDYKDLNKDLATTPIFRAGVNGHFVLATIDHWNWWGTQNIDAGIWGSARGGEWQPVYADPKPERKGRFYGFGNKLWKIDYSSGVPIFKVFSDFQPWTRVQTWSIVGAIAVDTSENSNTILVGAIFPPASANCPPSTDMSEFKLMMTRHGNKEPLLQGSVWTNLPNWDPALCTDCDPCDPVAAIAYDPSNPKQAYMMTYSGVTYKSVDVDNGIPFNPIGRWDLGNNCYPNEIEAGVRQLVINSDGDLFVISQCTNRDLVHCNQFARSFDGGENWNVIDNNTLPISIYHSLLADKNDPWTLYLSTQNGVYISIDRGDTWNRFDYGLPNVEIMQLLADDNRLYAVTYGRGLWYVEPCSW